MGLVIQGIIFEERFSLQPNLSQEYEQAREGSTNSRFRVPLITRFRRSLRKGILLHL
jgi:hypothetical protein